MLAETWGIPIVTLGELREDGADEGSIQHLLSSTAGFSAATICVGHLRLIVYNPRHSARRIANSLAHELSHTLLEHEPAPAIVEGVVSAGMPPHVAIARQVDAAMGRDGALATRTVVNKACPNQSIIEIVA